MIMNEIMENHATDAQISAYLVALHMKGETVDEITGSAEAFSDKTMSFKVKYNNMVDTCGTGGDNLHTFNISTTAAFVTAGAGVTVAKHGHRSVSSKCGSADLLASLGVNIEMNKRTIERCFQEVGLAFLFAPKFLKGWRYAFGPRREIGARTILNILGPLTNPVRTQRQLIGVYDPNLMHTIINVMLELGAEQMMVVHGHDGLDEITISGKTSVVEFIDRKIYEYEITPEDFQLQSAPISTIQSEGCSDSVSFVSDVLKGKPGPATDVVILNAGAAIKVSGKVNSLAEGIELAKESISSGAARKKLEKIIEITNQ